MLYDSDRRFLNAMGYQNGPMMIIIVTTSLHVLWCYFLIHVFGMGQQGIGMATTFTHFSSVIALHFYANKYMNPMHK
jgi:Na+-driven multidrug efflux pump